uniref:Putative zinc finger BED domain-containing protein RICESLEEPER 2-like n=1 Tax=Davidia involucrata TaxID=16924 RepID=A0A5B6ZFM2_DAVIN
MAIKMFAKFEKYWSEFSMILVIAVILDTRYKIQFVDFSYKKLYGSGSFEFSQVRDNLFSLFIEYVSTSLKSSTTPSFLGKPSSSGLDEGSFSMETRDVLKVLTNTN